MNNADMTGEMIFPRACQTGKKQPGIRNGRITQIDISLRRAVVAYGAGGQNQIAQTDSRLHCAAGTDTDHRFNADAGQFFHGNPGGTPADSRRNG